MKMERRDFLKRAVGVIAGVTVAPTVIKAKTKSNATIFPTKAKARVVAEYPLGTRRVDDCGRVFRYCQVKEKGLIRNDGQIVGVGTGDGWIQTWGVCDMPVVAGENLIHLNISV